MDRGPSAKFPFREGRNSPSEYEIAIAYFLLRDGWPCQSVVSAIAVWNREHGLDMKAYASRYAPTLVKASRYAAMAQPR
jgi:hypothetical protein